MANCEQRIKTFKGQVRAAVTVFRVNILHSVRDIRWIFLFFVMIVIIVRYVSPYVSYGLSRHERCTWCLLPLLMRTAPNAMNNSRVVLHAGMILLLCDAPFFREITPYAVLRSKRNGWWKGECLYIFGASLIYTGFIVFVSSVITLPVISFENSWKGVVQDFLYGSDQYTSAQLNSSAPHYAVDELVVRYIYPYSAQLYLFTACFASFSVLGLIMYLFALKWKNSRLGIAAAFFIVLLDPVVNYNMGSYTYWLAAFSPVSWCSVDRLDLLREEYFLSPLFTACAYTSLIAVLVFLIRRVSIRSEVDLVRETAD